MRTVPVWLAGITIRAPSPHPPSQRPDAVCDMGHHLDSGVVRDRDRRGRETGRRDGADRAEAVNGTGIASRCDRNLEA